MNATPPQIASAGRSPTERAPAGQGTWHLGPLTLTSRLVLGSARFPDPQVMLQALAASGTELVTVSIRRVSLAATGEEDTLALLRQGGYHLLPNTAGCHTVADALHTAELAREALGTALLKLEIIADEDNLYPDTEKLIEAARVLVGRGFVVLPYCNDDPIACRKLVDVGCAAVMPLGSPIGSGMGILNPYNLRLIRRQVGVPLLVDAGLGTASDVAQAFELGCDGVLLNTAVARARDPIMMARAMRHAALAGWDAYHAGRIPRRAHADASSPREGFPRLPYRGED